MFSFLVFSVHLSLTAHSQIVALYWYKLKESRGLDDMELYKLYQSPTDQAKIDEEIDREKPAIEEEEEQKGGENGPKKGSEPPKEPPKEEAKYEEPPPAHLQNAPENIPPDAKDEPAEKLGYDAGDVNKR